MHREPRGDEAAEHDDHHGEAHRQGDALAALAVGLDLLDDPVDQAAQAAALVAARAGLLGQPVEDHVDCSVAVASSSAVLSASKVTTVAKPPDAGSPSRVKPQGRRAGRALGHDERG